MKSWTVKEIADERDQKSRDHDALIHTPRVVQAFHDFGATRFVALDDLKKLDLKWDRWVVEQQAKEAGGEKSEEYNNVSKLLDELEAMVNWI